MEKEIIEAEIYKEGGLKMYNLFRFSQTLKILWLRRLTSTCSNGSWTTIPKLFGVSQWFFFGDSFVNNLLKKSNTFLEVWLNP